MLYADREQARSAAKGQVPVEGLTGAATEIKSLLTELAGEIEDSRRRQSNALFQIERKLHALEAGKAGPQGKSDRFWDDENSDALSEAYNHGQDGGLHYGPAATPDAGYDLGSDDTKSWLHARFADISQHIARSLSEMRPQSAVHALGERIELFHERVHDALEDVARRSDVEGLRLIEAHVIELGLKLSDVQAQLGRLDNIESDLRSVMDEVSGERLVRLSEHQDVLADAIDATAARTAEQLHVRMAEANAITAIDGGRFEELRGLIESAIIQQRQAEETATSAVSHMGTTAARQADGLNELKALVVSSISERRKGEQDALGMLDTVQQALVEVLDRIDALETKRAPETAKPEPSAFAELPIAPAAAADPAPAPQSARSAPAAPPAAPLAAKTERAPAWDIPSFAAASPLIAIDEEDEDLSPVERMRREFIADAQRAKLKAAASWAEGAKGEAQKGRKTADASYSSDAMARAKFFGLTPGLLVAALGLIVAINGGILLLSRKTPAPPVAVETLQDPLAGVPGSDRSEQAPRSDAGHGSDFAIHGDLGVHGDDVTNIPLEAPAEKAEETDANLDQAGSATTDDANSRDTATRLPLGTTVDTPVTASDETLAALYQQQVLSGLSDRTGSPAARSAPDAMMPERGDRMDASFTPPDIPKPANASQDGTRSTTLDLPPATVGPLSLRIAAAAGDPSAEFEVAARLAEGKGTNQNFKEAVRWYQRSAAQGFAQAQYRIGTMYERGLGVPKDLGRARVWYQRAAEQGNVKAMHNLAVLSAGGEGSGPDYPGATSWFIKAAEYGLPDSQYNLAVLFENGLGVPQDDKAAYKWYTLAARGGDKDALERQDALKAKLSAHDLKLAETLVSGFKPKPADPLANDARAAGEDWKKRANSDG